MSAAAVCHLPNKRRYLSIYNVLDAVCRVKSTAATVHFVTLLHWQCKQHMATLQGQIVFTF